MDFKNIDEEHDDSGNGLHFYYNREERLKNAPKIVQDYYNGRGPRPVKGVFKVLVATPANRFVLITLVAMTVFTWFFSRKSEKPYCKTVNGVQATLSAFSYEDSIYASLKLTPQKDKNAVSGRKVNDGEIPVSARFSSTDSSKQTVSEDEVSGRYSGAEIYLRTKFADYDIVNIAAKVTINGKSETLSAAVEKR